MRLAVLAAGTAAVGASGLTVGELAVVTGVSCLFGMMSSASRAAETNSVRVLRTVMLNGGAVWIAAFAIATVTEAKLASAALIGLGVGLAGSKVLEVIEAGAVAIAQRVSGKEPLTRAEVAEMIGDLRNDTQAAVSDINVQRRHPRKRKGGPDEPE